jgi:hypothetical protein
MILSSEIRLLAAMLCLAAGYPVTEAGHIKASTTAAAPQKPVPATPAPQKPAARPRPAVIDDDGSIPF